MAEIIRDVDKIKKILEESKTVAIIGCSPKEDKASNRVARYLKDKNYKIIPIHPKEEVILGEKAYKSLNDVKESVDIVDVFRPSDQILPHAEEAIKNKAKVFWMQLDIENQEAAEKLINAGIDVITNKCTKIEYENIIEKKIIL